MKVTERTDGTAGGSATPDFQVVAGCDAAQMSQWALLLPPKLSKHYRLHQYL